MQRLPTFVTAVVVLGAALVLYAPGAAQAVPATCSYQRCDDLLQNQADTSLYIGNSNGTAPGKAILFTNDGSSTQRWDIAELTDGNYVIYQTGNANNLLIARGSGCDGLTYCAITEDQTGQTPTIAEQWIEVQVDPFIFESDGSGDRCLDNFGGNSPAGSQIVLYPCSTSGDTAQEWLAKSS